MTKQQPKKLIHKKSGAIFEINNNGNYVKTAQGKGNGYLSCITPIGSTRMINDYEYHWFNEAY